MILRIWLLLPRPPSIKKVELLPKPPFITTSIEYTFNIMCRVKGSYTYIARKSH